MKTFLALAFVSLMASPVFAAVDFPAETSHSSTIGGAPGFQVATIAGAKVISETSYDEPGEEHPIDVFTLKTEADFFVAPTTKYFEYNWNVQLQVDPVANDKIDAVQASCLAEQSDVLAAIRNSADDQLLLTYSTPYQLVQGGLATRQIGQALLVDNRTGGVTHESELLGQTQLKNYWQNTGETSRALVAIAYIARDGSCHVSPQASLETALLDIGYGDFLTFPLYDTSSSIAEKKVWNDFMAFYSMPDWSARSVQDYVKMIRELQSVDISCGPSTAYYGLQRCVFGKTYPVDIQADLAAQIACQDPEVQKLHFGLGSCEAAMADALKTKNYSETWYDFEFYVAPDVEDCGLSIVVNRQNKTVHYSGSCAPD